MDEYDYMASMGIGESKKVEGSDIDADEHERSKKKVATEEVRRPASAPRVPP